MNAHASPTVGHRRSWSFPALLATQFLGAFNDNVLKQFIVLQIALGGMWASVLGAGGQGILAICFTLPFIFLSGWAGEYADKKSKRWLAVDLKGIEIPIVLVGGIGIYFGSLWVTFGALVLLAAQSAAFGPAKYGMIPEILPQARLPRGNGAITMLTNVAVIAGIVAGGFASDVHPTQPTFCLTVLLVAAVIGRITVIGIEPLPPRDPGLRMHANPFHPYLKSLREMVRSRNQLDAMLAWSFFYFVAQGVLVGIPDMKSDLSMFGHPTSDKEISYLNAILAVVIGVGSVLAGWAARGRILKSHMMFGGIGISLGLLGFLVIPRTWEATLCLTVFLGLGSGFYLIPLMSYIQASAPPAERGQFLGTANFLSFCMLAASGGLYWVVGRLGLAPWHFMGLCGLLLLGVLILARNMKLDLHGSA